MAYFSPVKLSLLQSKVLQQKGAELAILIVLCAMFAYYGEDTPGR
jgi:hypothetical protein